jgi:hypothetical protein
MLAITGIVDTRVVFEWIAHVASGVALWASVRADRIAQDELTILTLRLRQPVRFAVTYPLRALARLARRTTSSRPI